MSSSASQGDLFAGMPPIPAPPAPSVRSHNMSAQSPTGAATASVGAPTQHQVDEFKSGVPVGAPFRIQPRDADRLTLERLNRTQGRAGARRYEDTESAADRARTAKSIGDTRLEAVLTHPSESVPIALLRNTQPQRPYRDRTATLVCDTLYQRAMCEALAERAIWTPLLDALAATGHWPREQIDYSKSRSVDEECALLSAADWRWVLLGDAEATMPWTSIEKRAGRLRGWVETATDSDVVLTLLAFKTAEVRETAVRCARCLDEHAVARILGGEPNLALALAENPHLPDALRETIAWWALTQLGVATPHTVPAAQRRITEASDPLGVLTALRDVGYVAPPAIADVLVRAIPRRNARIVGAAPPSTPLALALAALGLGASDAQLADAARALYDRAGQFSSADVDGLIALATAAAAGPETWTAVAEAPGKTSVREALVELPGARQHPAVRRILRSSTNATVLRALALEADVEEYRYLMRRALQRDPLATLNTLSTAGGLLPAVTAIGPVPALRPDDLEPLLHDPAAPKIAILQALDTYRFASPAAEDTGRRLVDAHLARVLTAVAAAPMRPGSDDLARAVVWLAQRSDVQPLAQADVETMLAHRLPKTTSRSPWERVEGMREWWSLAAELQRVRLASDVQTWLTIELRTRVPPFFREAADLLNQVNGAAPFVEDVLADATLVPFIEPADLAPLLAGTHEQRRLSAIRALSVAGTGVDLEPPVSGDPPHAQPCTPSADSPRIRQPTI